MSEDDDDLPPPVRRSASGPNGNAAPKRPSLERALSGPIRAVSFGASENSDSTAPAARLSPDHSELERQASWGYSFRGVLDESGYSDEPAPFPLHRRGSSSLGEASNDIWRQGHRVDDLLGHASLRRSSGASSAKNLLGTLASARASSPLDKTGGRVLSKGDLSKILASYSSRILLERLSRKTTDVPEWKEERFSLYAAIAFVDVSGFTKLSETLSKEHGPVVGAELLNIYINSFLEQLINITLVNGGDIIKFAGDAMQVCLPFLRSCTTSAPHG